MRLNNEHTEKILVEFLKNEIFRTGLKKAVIGLSGGIDSAVSAALTAKAVGRKNLTCLLMPYKTSSKTSITDAMKIVKMLNVKFRKINITKIADSFFKSIDDKDISKVRKGNIMARIRMVLLYDDSAKSKSLVIGTGNKTEILLGYSTLFGDSACAINPIGDLYKTQVIELAKHLGIPESIINKKPSADLWEGQTDEGEFGFTYEKADKYLFGKIDERKTDKELKEAGYDVNFMKRINSMVIKNQFKRLPPVIAKVSNRTVNIDFRYNRDWNT